MFHMSQFKPYVQYIDFLSKGHIWLSHVLPFYFWSHKFQNFNLVKRFKQPLYLIHFYKLWINLSDSWPTKSMVLNQNRFYCILWWLIQYHSWLNHHRIWFVFSTETDSTINTTICSHLLQIWLYFHLTKSVWDLQIGCI